LNEKYLSSVSGSVKQEVHFVGSASLQSLHAELPAYNSLLVIALVAVQAAQEVSVAL